MIMANVDAIDLCQGADDFLVAAMQHNKTSMSVCM